MAIKAGDRVRFSAEFCRNTGQYTGDVPFARGTVKALKLRVGNTQLAEVDWQNEEMPIMVLTCNLEVCK